MALPCYICCSERDILINIKWGHIIDETKIILLGNIGYLSWRGFRKFFEVIFFIQDWFSWTSEPRRKVKKIIWSRKLIFASLYIDLYLSVGTKLMFPWVFKVCASFVVEIWSCTVIPCVVMSTNPTTPCLKIQNFHQNTAYPCHSLIEKQLIPQATLTHTPFFSRELCLLKSPRDPCIPKTCHETFPSPPRFKPAEQVILLCSFKFPLKRL